MQQAAKAEAGKKRKADAQAAKAKKAKPAKKHNPRVFFGESRKACLVHTATAVRGVVDGVRVCCDCNQPRLPCISAQRLPCFSTSPLYLSSTSPLSQLKHVPIVKACHYGGCLPRAACGATSQDVPPMLVASSAWPHALPLVAWSQNNVRRRPTRPLYPFVELRPANSPRSTIHLLQTSPLARSTRVAWSSSWRTTWSRRRPRTSARCARGRQG